MGDDLDHIPIIIIGNKIDSDEREVKTEDAEAFCKEQNYPYFETSAKTGENVDETIKYLVKQVIKKNSIFRNKLNNSENSIRISKNKGEGNCPC